jgi:Fur family ferric uptake transcriptional regulator
MMRRLPLDQAEPVIRATGARVTRARVRVLAALLAAGRALTHHEVEKRVKRAYGIDRVTVYRVLEWLTDYGLAHKIPGGDRVWRFSAAIEEHARQHAHFECSRCGTVICVDGLAIKPRIKLPSGFRSQQVELTVKGLCARCVPARPRGLAQRQGTPE